MNYLGLFVPLKFPPFQFVHEEVNFEKGKLPNDNVNESIALLTKHFSNVIRKIKKHKQSWFK